MMPDPFDHASETEQQTLQDHLQAQAVRASLAPGYMPRGYCMNPHCAEEFPSGDNRLFCDSRCAAEHQRLARN